MDIFVPVFALFFIGIGFFVKKYPETMSGYNTMPKEKLKNVDLQAIGNLFCKGFLLMGASMIALYFLFRLLGMTLAAQTAWLVPLFIVVPVLLVIAQKYDLNRRSAFMKWLPAGLIVVIFAGTSILLAYGLQPTKAVIGDDSVRFTGQYGVTVPFDKVAECELLERIPRIGVKTNGLAVAGICKGHFLLDGMGKCRLFVRFPHPPYLYIDLTGGEKIIFNSPDPALTEELFGKISVSAEVAGSGL